MARFSHKEFVFGLEDLKNLVMDTLIPVDPWSQESDHVILTFEEECKAKGTANVLRFNASVHFFPLGCPKPVAPANFEYELPF